MYPPQSVRVLIVEDDPKTALLLSECLAQEGFEVSVADDGEAGLQEAIREAFDVLVVDVMLPKRDGLSLVRELRAQRHMTPVLMLSARSGVQQRVEGLDAGADDYLPKPYFSSELIARVRSLVRRTSLIAPGWLTIADLSFHTVTREVKRAGRRIDLSSRERTLFACLVEAGGQVVSRRDILLAVWDYNFDPGSNLVEVYIRRLREKIDRDHTPNLIQTVRGLGYALRIVP